MYHPLKLKQAPEIITDTDQKITSRLSQTSDPCLKLKTAVKRARKEFGEDVKSIWYCYWVEKMSVKINRGTESWR